MSKTFIKSYFSLLLFFVIASVQNSCDIINPPEATPSFLQIDSISVNSNYLTSGSGSSNITEAWIFVDGQHLGVHDLPLNIPILNEGKHQLSILAGIKRNGLSSKRVDYPFYTSFESEVTFSPEDTLMLSPTIEYRENLNVWTEDFEDPGIKFVTNSASDTNFVITKEDGEVFEGNASGKVEFGEGVYNFVVRTDEQFQFPRGQPVFVEVDYNTTEVFEVGIVVNLTNETTTSTVGFVKASNHQGSREWRKIYFDLSEVINQNSQATSYEVFFAASGNDSGDSEIIFDNIKIIYP